MIVPVIYGSVRRDRVGIRAARFLTGQLAGRGHEAVLVDPLEYTLPLLDRMYKEFPAGEAPQAMQRLATLFRRADAFVICTGEYNHSIPPALTNLLDHFLEEYYWRPSAIACYSPGTAGGLRAAMQVRALTGELGMPSIPSILSFAHITTLLDEAGALTDQSFQKRADRFLVELEWYAEALRAQRARGMPY